jgi:hypothetical protein
VPGFNDGGFGSGEFGGGGKAIVYDVQFIIPAQEVQDLVDSAEIYLDLQPSGVDVYNNTQIYVDSGTVYLDIRVSVATDIAAYIDLDTVYFDITPAADEEFFTAPPPVVPPEPIIGYVPPPTHGRAWKIIHKIGEDELGEVYPESLRFGTFLSKPGYVNYEIDMEHPLGRQENTQPFYTDWELRRGDSILKDLSGFHTEVQVSEDESTFIQVAGQTWLHYFEHLYWPFNPTSPLQYNYTAAATDLFTIVDAILDTALAQADALAFTYSFGTSGQTTNFKIDSGDQESIFGKIEQLSKLSPGFDIYVTPSREIKLFAPKMGIERNLVFEFHGTHRNVELINFTDKGSKPVLKGFGSTNSQRAGYVQSATGRRRYEEMKDYGEVASQTALEALVNADQDRLEVTNYQFSLRWTGRDELDDLLDQVDIGDIVSVYGDTGYNQINDEYRIVGIEGEVSNEADAIYVVTFDDGTLSL